MRPLRAWCTRLLGMFGKTRRDRELAEEIESHLQLHVDDKVRAGMTPEEARRQAIVEFGAVESIKESYRDRRGVPMIDTLMRDVSWGWRVLLRDPGFAVVAVLTLALGIAATTAVFSIVDAVLLRPLPYPEADRLVAVGTADAQDPGRARPLSTGIFTALRERATALERIVAYQQDRATLLGGGEPRLVAVGRVTDGFFELFGGTPLLGRTLIAADHSEDAERLVVLSHALWQSAWGGDPAIVGKRVTLSDAPHTVVGVLAPQFRHPEAAGGSPNTGAVDLWAPLRLEAAQHLQYIGLGRLAEDATVASAQAQVDAIVFDAVAPLLAGMPETFPTRGAVTPLQAKTIGDIGDTLAVFLGAAGLLLLIACANVAYLLLARGVHRRQELVLRTALGAHRSRVARQLFVESLLLALMGGAAGTALTYVVVGVFQAADPGTIPRFTEVVVDGRILSFALALAGITGVVFGLAPMLQLSHNNPAQALREGAPGFSDGHSARRLRSSLVVAQTALALVLLVGAGLLVNSFAALSRGEAGFDPSGLALVEAQLPLSFAERAQGGPFFDELLERTRATVDADAVALTTTPPYTSSFRWALVPEGWEQTRNTAEQPFIRGNVVSLNYFSVMGIPLLAGRPFDEDDRPGAPVVALVNEAFVRAYWPGKDPLGKRIIADFRRFSADSLNVIGVVGDVRAEPGAEADPEIYMLAAQQPRRTMTLVARTRGDAASLIPAMREAIWALDPDLPIRRATTMEAVASELIAGPRFYALLSTSFAGAALVLALVGIYGTAAHAANRRRREISIRSALGAEAAAIVRLVVRDGVVLAVIGVLIGAFLSRWLAGFLSGLLFGVREGDVATLFGCAALFVATSCVASLIPALRAARTDPVAALRADR